MPQGFCYGRRDVALQPGWAASMPDLAARAARSGPLAVVSSPATRCARPARMLAELLQLPLRLDADLLELDFGAWEGLSWDAVPREALDAWAADPLRFAPPGGESGAGLLSRVRRAAFRLRPGPALVVSHGGPLRVLPALLRGERPDLLGPAPAMGSLQHVSVR